MIIILLILTAVLWGSTPILEKIGLARVDPLLGITIRSIAVTVILLIIMVTTGRIKEIITVDHKTILIFAASGILAGLLGMLTYFGALKAGATSKIVPIAATYPLVTAFLSVLILKEAFSVPRIIGTVLIVLGIWLVK
jgi:transporter family protein